MMDETLLAQYVRDIWKEDVPKRVKLVLAPAGSG